jgi:initiation factor 1A
MVKNTKGGNRHKKMARKHLAEDNVKVKTRLANPKEACEIYATVTKMYGQGNCQVLCCDGKERLCVIRKIFKGRNKSKNFINVDTKVLVGLRDWESARDGKQEKCDLLEVYDRSQHNDLKKDPFCKWEIIASSVEKDMINNGTEEMFEFANVGYDSDDEDTSLNEDTNANTIVYEGETINFDDI